MVAAEAHPHQVLAPPPWVGQPVPLPLELEPSPVPRPACRRCGRTDRRLRRELRRARSTFDAMTELIEQLRDVAANSERGRAGAEQECGALLALVSEFDRLAKESEQVLVRAGRSWLKARSKWRRARKQLRDARARGSRLQAQLLEAQAARPEGADPADGVAPDVAMQRVRELTEALRRERDRKLRYKRYARALEARLQEVAEELASGASPVGASPAGAAVRGAAVGAAAAGASGTGD